MEKTIEAQWYLIDLYQRKFKLERNCQLQISISTKAFELAQKKT